MLESPPKRVSPRKAVLGAGTFYSKQKPLYLTPLERKVLNEAKSPPSVGKEPSRPPLTAANPVVKPAKKVQKKPRASAPQSNLKGYFTAKPKAKKSPSDKQTDQALKSTVAPISFSSMKSKGKPKLVVGAAFFSTGKKPSSMYKKSVQNTKPKPTYEKPSIQKPVREKEVVTAPGQRSPVRRAVFLKKQPEVDVPHDKRESTQAMSPRVLADLHGITKELRVVLRRSVSPETGSQVRLN